MKNLIVKIFSPLIEKYESYFSVLREALPRAGIRLPFKVYMSIALFLVTLVFFLSLFLGVVAFQLFGRDLLTAFFYSLVSAMLISVIEFIFIFYYPIQKANARKKSIEANLPFVISHLGALAESGIPPYVMFKLVSQFREYGEISKEMEKIVRNIEVFGLDPMTAIKEVAERTPSDSFKQLLMGFITTTESGGSIKLYLKEVGEQTIFEWRTKREKFIRFLDTFAEFYTGIIIAAPMFLIALLSVMSMIEPNIGGWSILDLTRISVYVVVPLINIGFVLFLHGIEVEI